MTIIGWNGSKQHEPEGEPPQYWPRDLSLAFRLGLPADLKLERLRLSLDRSFNHGVEPAAKAARLG